MVNSPITLSRQTARRLILGNHGHWPGRRFASPLQLEQAICDAGMIQIDPVTTLHRNHDLVLHSRVEDYHPSHLDELAYSQRRLFDYGHVLHYHPIADLGTFLPVMQWHTHRSQKWQSEHAEVVELVLNSIEANGPMTSREFTDRNRVAGGFWREKDTSIALYHLFLTGKLTTHSRRNADRVYDLLERVHREFALDPLTPEDALNHLARKAASDLGIFSKVEFSRRLRMLYHRVVSARAQELLDEMCAEGVLIPIQIEDDPKQRYITEPLWEFSSIVDAGQSPAQWSILYSSSQEQVSFIAPLDNVIWDRARLQTVFDFEYVWEVYHAPSKVRWGRYVLPILWGDEFAARMDAKIDRKSRTLHVQGFWPESQEITSYRDFKEALIAGLGRLAAFHEAVTIDASSVPSPWRAVLERAAPTARTRSRTRSMMKNYAEAHLYANETDTPVI